MSKKKLLLYALTIIAGILWQTDILEGSFTFYTFLRILGFIVIFVVYEVWIQVLLPMWEEWEKDDKYKIANTSGIGVKLLLENKKYLRSINVYLV